MLKTEAIVKFLKTTGNSHLTNLYNPNMEVQVNVKKEGTKVGGNYKGKKWQGWTDGKETWKSFRIPWQADTNPTYQDSEIRFNLFSHVEGIGMTGWDWKNKQSIWVGFDFDSMANHKEGLSDQELELVRNLTQKIPYTTIIKSTSGKGLHIYVHLSKPIVTNTHTEHAALARSILGLLSMEANYNFNNSIDCCGMILWVYHKKQENTDGLSLIKMGDKLESNLIPSNWRDHIDVTSKRRSKVKNPTHKNNESLFEQLISSEKKVKLDDEHNELLQWFKISSQKDWWWDTDHNMLVCHTYDLAKAHSELGLTGIFYTSSSGSSDQNCFAFPLTEGAWVIRRHSLKVREHPSWTIDPNGWTKCYYNTLPEFEVCCKANNGVENTRGEFVFSTVKEGLKSLSDMAIYEVVIPNGMQERELSLLEKKDGKVIISFGREARDDRVVGFLSNKKGDKWEKVIHRVKRKREVTLPDNLIRHVIANGVEAGWWIFTCKQWVGQSKSNVTTVLTSIDDAHTKNDIELMMSRAILNPWELVNIPFEEEYPGDRKWNKESAKLSCKPESGSCPTWLTLLKHVGSSLDSAVLENMWCVDNYITSGSEYLLNWIGSMFQKPKDPLPYLFFIGPQESGKSTLHEALSKLMIRGYVRADNALLSQSGFNSEIGNAILCVVEETNLNKNKDAANRIKDWVTGKTISIRALYKNAYDITNTTHWIQCANDFSYGTVFPGDTRIVVVQVDKPKKEIPKNVLFENLEDEKRHFLDLILSIELPEPNGRLAIPCLATNTKNDIEAVNSNELQLFIKENIQIANGYSVTFEEFYTKLTMWLSPENRLYWTKQKVSRELILVEGMCKGKTGEKNITVLGNITFKSEKVTKKSFKYYTDIKNRLQKKGL